MHFRCRTSPVAAAAGKYAEMMAIKRNRSCVFTIKLGNADLLVTNHGQSESSKARYLILEWFRCSVVPMANVEF